MNRAVSIHNKQSLGGKPQKRQPLAIFSRQVGRPICVAFIVSDSFFLVQRGASNTQLLVGELTQASHYPEGYFSGWLYPRHPIPRDRSGAKRRLVGGGGAPCRSTLSRRVGVRLGHPPAVTKREVACSTVECTSFVCCEIVLVREIARTARSTLVSVTLTPPKHSQRRGTRPAAPARISRTLAAMSFQKPRRRRSLPSRRREKMANPSVEVYNGSFLPPWEHVG